MIKLSQAQVSILLTANNKMGGKWYAHFHTHSLASLFCNKMLITKHGKLYITAFGRLALKNALRKDYLAWKDTSHNTAETRRRMKRTNQLSI